MRRSGLSLLLLAMLLGSACAQDAAMVSGMRAKFLMKHPLLAKHHMAPPVAVSGAPGAAVTPTAVPAQCLSVAEVAQQAGSFSSLLAAAQVGARGAGPLVAVERRVGSGGPGGGRAAAAGPASPASRRAAARSPTDACRIAPGARLPGGCSLHRAAHGEPPLAEPGLACGAGCQPSLQRAGRSVPASRPAPGSTRRPPLTMVPLPAHR